jgi:hypothetical protein
MDERETSPLIKLIEENRTVLAARMIDANIGAGGYAQMSPRAAAVAVEFMGRVLDSVVSWLRDYSVYKEGFLVALDYQAQRGLNVSPQEAIARVNQTLEVVAEFAAAQFGPGPLADRAAHQIHAAATIGRLVVANETIKRANRTSRARAE